MEAVRESSARMDAAKRLYRRLDTLFGEFGPGQRQAKHLEVIFEAAFDQLAGDLRLLAGLLYAERPGVFALVSSVGKLTGPTTETLDPARAPLAEVIDHRVYIYGDPDTADAPQRLGLLPRVPAAALVVGRRPRRFCLFFLLDQDWELSELDFALNTIRAALDARLEDAKVRGSFIEAAEIQRSLLVEEAPEFPGYDVAWRSVAAEEVGGDFYDFVDLGDDTLGLAIGDASGHGLPAALLVRDVVTGLRMGIEKELKITHVFERLNRVIHRSRLSSRFVSMFYAELEQDGDLFYVNAGHPPPILLFGEPGPGRPADLELATGGTVIGPLPDVRFRRGFARIHRGEVLVLCTDGILERADRLGESFGAARLRDVVSAHRAQSARDILDRIFEAATMHGDGRPWEDDATVVVLKRDAEPA